MDPFGEMLEEPLFLDGIAIRQWSDFARLPRPREAPSDSADASTDTDPDALTPVR
ncbi:MAG TPA: hypothetical protein VGB58_03310 [Blastococcus sp.]